MFSSLHEKQKDLLQVRRSIKRKVMMGLDALFLPICLWASYVLRLSDWWPESYIVPNWWIFPLVSVVGVAIFSVNRVYRTILRFAGAQTVTQLFRSVFFLALFVMALDFFKSGQYIPRSIPIIFALVTLCYAGLSRFIYRHYYHWILKNILPHETIAIYGAGGAGVQLAVALADSREYKTVAFIDDDPNLHNSIIQGIRVYPSSALPDLQDRFDLKRVLLAIPSASPAEKRQVLERLSKGDINVLTVPSMMEIVTGAATVDVLREVEIDDLLGRETVPPREDLLQNSIKEKSVLVTGAGGSIGSELCRQILNIGPDRLVLYENCEFNLYQIEQELSQIIKKRNLSITIVPIMGSVCDFDRLNRVVSHFDIQVFYHAAAYKHVPLVEQNVFVGIENNIKGTLNACEAAFQNNIERFILISTDKAVRPTNVMGATKRVAELIVQAKAANPDTKTIFSMVRFGNVLGSSGSVVPLFRRQIAEGGPVTVTHRDVTRYFMTIPEAALLVIQAGSLAKGGDVFVLDMGQEVRIQDMAREMIHLSGLDVRDENNPDGDIEIQYTGLRPGEKVREELLIGDCVTRTRHPLIMRAMEEEMSQEALDIHLDALKSASEANDIARARSVLATVAKGYKPDEAIVDCLSAANVRLVESPTSKLTDGIVRQSKI
ncbi:polysaccharide biosynthesis protein [Cohaesibacter celericrescens]|uniref:Polysaccharide biosynthesis protein n=1 Tax=Cohaesibacter celericrescens TaxID=2067669 RepID=A0A2N5XUI0_9HYPH|nr:nucleoside-diphosphate sugar epimerase/dehydratase [Cohaesibacter celericrescens]PLW78149.1 polysaccharide biosynthesis protein [Cohaesibacter celericrescens]